MGKEVPFGVLSWVPGEPGACSSNSGVFLVALLGDWLWAAVFQEEAAKEECQAYKGL